MAFHVDNIDSSLRTLIEAETSQAVTTVDAAAVCFPILV